VFVFNFVDKKMQHKHYQHYRNANNNGVSKKQHWNRNDIGSEK